MIVLFTDFGVLSPYLGQVKAVLYQQAPGIPIVDLFADAPALDPHTSAYLLAAFTGSFPPGSIFLCVVDPGVGSVRRAAVVKADGQWFVGPDNGLFNVIAMRAQTVHWWDITWRPPRLSATFHGRDLFAPVAAHLAHNEPPPGVLQEPWKRIASDWPKDLAKIVYIDHYGNAMTGLRAGILPTQARLEVKGRTLLRAYTFSAVARGQVFWYENANGLAEIAVNQGSARDILALRIGDSVAVLD